MSDHKSTRRRFLKLLGLSVGVVASTNALASFIDEAEIKRLNPEQQEFMVRYGKWMDELTLVARIQKTDPDNHENQKKMMVLGEKAEEMKPELTKHLSDETFALIYTESIKRLSNEI